MYSGEPYLLMETQGSLDSSLLGDQLENNSDL